MSENIIINNQWDDFLVRSADPYANAKYEILMSWLPDLKNKKVLVVGSGSGELAVTMAHHGAAVTAIDIAQEYVDLTAQNAKKAGLSDVKCEVSTIENFKSSTQFDVVVATDVIEHIEDDKNAFNLCLSHLVDGGLLVITVPSLQFLYGHHDKILGHFRRYNMRSFRRLVPDNIKTLQLRYFGFFLIPVALLISRILKTSYPVQQVGQEKSKKSLMSYLIRFLFFIEKEFVFPLGTSLLFLGKK